MSVFIKGMDAPKDCAHCWNHFSCPFYKTDSKSGFKDSRCPIVEVSAPHERLVEVTKELDVALSNFTAETGLDEAPYMDASYWLESSAPTVIEAEQPDTTTDGSITTKTDEIADNRTTHDCANRQPAIVESHSEKQILEGCISLIQEMCGYFREYLDFIDHEPEYEEEKQPFRLSYFHIVKRLFLWHTSHSGGNSTRTKCAELGISDSSEDVLFPIWRDENDG